MRDLKYNNPGSIFTCYYTDKHADRMDVGRMHEITSAIWKHLNVEQKTKVNKYWHERGIKYTFEREERSKGSPSKNKAAGKPNVPAAFQ